MLNQNYVHYEHGHNFINRKIDASKLILSKMKCI